MDVGFIGLGNMGTPMALNLIKAGHRVVVYNRRRSKASHTCFLAAETLRTESNHFATDPRSDWTTETSTALPICSTGVLATRLTVSWSPGLGHRLALSSTTPITTPDRSKWLVPSSEFWQRENQRDGVSLYCIRNFSAADALSSALNSMDVCPARAWRGLPPRVRQSFFERLHGIRILLVGLRPRTHMRESQVLQGAIDRVVRYRDAELFVQPHNQNNCAFCAIISWTGPSTCR